MRSAIHYLQKTSSTKWVESFLREMKIAYKPQLVTYYLGADYNITLDLRVIPHSKSGLRKFNIFACEDSFFDCNKCVIFIDHEALPILDYCKETMIPLK